LSVIIGNYPTSKLWDKKFANCTYCVGSELRWTATRGGFFVYSGAASIDNAREIDKNLWPLLENLEISESELEWVKKIKSIEILKMKEEGERGLLKFIFCSPLLRHKDFSEIIEGVNQVKKNEVLSLAKRLLTKENSIKITVGAEK
jgi:predicted Zn-dependent peptidase